MTADREAGEKLAAANRELSRPKPSFTVPSREAEKPVLAGNEDELLGDFLWHANRFLDTAQNGFRCLITLGRHSSMRARLVEHRVQKKHAACVSRSHVNEEGYAAM
jgi:hypothetical protein